MSITGQNIIDKAHSVLSDVNIYWPDTELLGWLNSGFKEIAILKPNAAITVASVPCVAGTRQALPAGGLMLVDVIRNMGVDGTIPGRVITPLSRTTLDASNPNWHSAPASASARHFIFDPRYPKAFYVCPPQPSVDPGYIELIYGVCATPLAALADNVSLDDIYENVLLDYVLYRAFGKDSTESTNVAASQAHYASFAAALGAKVQADAAIQPAMPTNGKQAASQVKP